MFHAKFFNTIDWDSIINTFFSEKKEKIRQEEKEKEKNKKIAVFRGLFQVFWQGMIFEKKNCLNGI